MDPRDRKLLEETLDIARENNKMLKTLRSALHWSRVYKTVYWVIIIGSMLGLYYHFQPLIDNLKGAYEGIMGVFGKGEEVMNDAPDIGTLLKR